MNAVLRKRDKVFKGKWTWELQCKIKKCNLNCQYPKAVFFLFNNYVKEKLKIQLRHGCLIN